MVTDDLVTGSNETKHYLLSKKRKLTEPLRKTRARGHNTVLGAPCSNSMLTLRSDTVLIRSNLRQPRNVLSTLSFSDLRMKRPNSGYDQERVQRRTRTTITPHIEIG